MKLMENNYTFSEFRLLRFWTLQFILYFNFFNFSMFTVAPQVKTFFKGAENMTPEQVPGSDRFKIQGQRLIMALHELVEICGNKALFDCYMRDFMERHKQRGVGADLFDVWF